VFVRFGPVAVALIADGVTRFIHADRRGSTRFFTSEAGVPLARISYHPFGNLRDADPAALRLYALHPFDDEAGLFYFGRRHYAPELGRFTTPDPLYLLRPEREGAEPRTLYLYAYVGNDPINHVDPSGLSFWSVLGAIVGVIVGVIVGALFVVSLFFGVGWVLLAIAGIIAIVTAGYLAARFTSGGASDFFRGFLIGFNAGLTFILATAVGLTFLPVGWALAIGIVLGVIVMLSAIDTVAQNPVYQGILGWTSWFMPTTWVINGLGLAFFVLNFLGALFTLWQVDSLAITGMGIDWKTGTIFMKGGWISNLNTFDTAFNMGHFAFVDRNSASYHIDHESGHTLNLAAFGSVFHLVGFIDEMITGSSAYSEQLAESHDASGTRPKIPMWS
jgi:RHS repeat-associated protein